MRSTAAHDISRCFVCGAPITGPSLETDDASVGLHPSCLAGRLPCDAVAALIATAALFVIPFIRVWSA